MWVENYVTNKLSRSTTSSREDEDSHNKDIINQIQLVQNQIEAKKFLRSLR